MAEFEKPSNTEDEYFAREDLEKKRKLMLEEAHKMAATERENLKKLHWMRCPKDGMELQTVKEGPVEIDVCLHCGGIFLDKGELEKLREAGDSRAPVVDAVLNWFRRK